MKPFLKIAAIVLLAGSAHLAPAQNFNNFNPEAAVQKMFDHGLISSVELSTLENILKDGSGMPTSFSDYGLPNPDPRTPYGLLAITSTLMDQRMITATSLIYTSGFDQMTFDEQYALSSFRDFITASYGEPMMQKEAFDGSIFFPHPDTVLLRMQNAVHSLQLAGFYDPQAESVVMSDVTSTMMFTMGSMMTVASRQVSFRENYPAYRQAELRKVRALIESGIIPQDKFTAIDQSYKMYELKGDTGLVRWCDNSAIVNSREYISGTDKRFNATEDFPAIIRRVCALVPELKVQNIRVKEELRDLGYEFDAELPGTGIYIIYELDANGRTYRLASFDRYASEESYPSAYLPWEIHNIVNKALADMESPVRIHAFEYNSWQLLDAGMSDSASFPKMGYIALSESQYMDWESHALSDSLLSQWSWGLPFDMADFTSKYSPTAIDKYWQNLAENGLLSQLSMAQRDSVKAVVDESMIISYYLVLEKIPGLLGQQIYYAEDGLSTYADALNQLNKVSGNRMGLSKVKIKPTGKDSYLVSYRAGTSKVKREYSFLDGEVDPAFYTDAFEAALNDKNGKGSFVTMSDGYLFIYLTPEQEVFLRNDFPEVFEYYMMEGCGH